MAARQTSCDDLGGVARAQPAPDDSLRRREIFSLFTLLDCAKSPTLRAHPKTDGQRERETYLVCWRRLSSCGQQLSRFGKHLLSVFLFDLLSSLFDGLLAGRLWGFTFRRVQYAALLLQHSRSLATRGPHDAKIVVTTIIVRSGPNDNSDNTTHC